MNERETKQLIKLLGKFREAKVLQNERKGEEYLSVGERGIINQVEMWAKWYANEELNMDVY